MSQQVPVLCTKTESEIQMQILSSITISYPVILICALHAGIPINLKISPTIRAPIQYKDVVLPVK